MDIINFRVSPIGDSLELWVEVPEGSNYDDILIDKIAIQNHQNYTVGYPIIPQVELTLSHPLDDLKIIDQKKVVKVIKFKDLGQLGFQNTGLFFMYVWHTGLPAIDTPCCCIKNPAIAVAANLYPIYNKAIKLLNDYNNKCNSNNKALLIDIYLKKQMFLTAIELEDYSTAIHIWDNFVFPEVVDGNCLNSCSFSPEWVNPTSPTNIPFSGGCKHC